MILRSGAVDDAGRDTSIHWRAVKSNFDLPVTSEEFESARMGPSAYVLSDNLPSSFVFPLPIDPHARWINETGSAGTGNSVLYAVPFDLHRPFVRATFEIDFAVDNSLGMRGHPGLYLNELPIAGSTGGDHRRSSHLFCPDVHTQLHQGRNVLYILTQDTGLAGGVIFSARIRTWATGQSPILNARVFGPPIVRNNRSVDYTLELTNSSADTVHSALVCVFVSDTTATLEPLFPMADPLPLPDPGIESIPSMMVVDGHLCFGFLALRVPPNSTDRSRDIRIRFHLHSGSLASHRITAIALPLDGEGVPPGGADLSAFPQAMAFLPCVGRLFETWGTFWFGDYPGWFRCGATVFGNVLQSLFDPQAPAYFNRSLQDFLVVVGTGALECGVVPTWKWMTKQAPRIFFKTTLGIGLFCGGASMLHECVDDRIQNCQQILEQAMSVFVARSIDPNALAGPLDEAQGPFVTGEGALEYVTHFENLASASLAAQSIVLVDSLRPTSQLDWGSFRVQQLILGDRQFDLSAVDMRAPVWFDLRPVSDLLLRVSIRAEPVLGRWQLFLDGMDPITGRPPHDMRGILPPNHASPEGEGSISWSIRPISGLADGDSLGACARVRFDDERWLATNSWVNVIDVSPPSAQVSNVETGEVPTEARVTIGAADAGSGVVWTGLEVMDERDIAWTQAAGDDGAVVLSSSKPVTLRVRAIARDAVGNVAVAPSAEIRTIELPWPAVEAMPWRVYPSLVGDGILRYHVPTSGARIEFVLYDVTGRCVARHSEDRVGQTSGDGEWHIAGESGSLRSGAYFLRGHIGDHQIAQKVLLLGSGARPQR